MTRPDLNDFAWFVHVVEEGGFAAAGRALDEPKSKLSRRIAQLEERLGVRLIQRTTRQFNVTEVGQTFYEHCKAMLVEAQAAQVRDAAQRIGQPRSSRHLAQRLVDRPVQNKAQRPILAVLGQPDQALMKIGVGQRGGRGQDTAAEADKF